MKTKVEPLHTYSGAEIAHFLKDYGFDFFHKLNHYQTCTYYGEHFKIDSINFDDLRLVLSRGDQKVEASVFDCWNFVL